MSIEARLIEAGRSLRESFDPVPPGLPRRRTGVPRSRIAFALVVLALVAVGVGLLASGGSGTSTGPATEVPPTVPEAPATVGNYVGFLTKGEWLDNQRTLGLRFEFWSTAGTIPSPGRVVGQDPPAGSPLTKATLLRLQVGAPSFDVPGEIPVGISGTHPTWGYWRLSVTPPRDAGQAASSNPSLVTVLVHREVGSGEAMTFDRESVFGPRATTPLPGALYPPLPMWVTDLRQPNTLSFGLAPADSAAVLLTDGGGAELGRAQIAQVELNGDRFVVWATDLPRPTGSRLRAVGPDGGVLADAGMA